MVFLGSYNSRDNVTITREDRSKIISKSSPSKTPSSLSSSSSSSKKQNVKMISTNPITNTFNFAKDSLNLLNKMDTDLLQKTKTNTKTNDLTGYKKVDMFFRGLLPFGLLPKEARALITEKNEEASERIYKSKKSIDEDKFEYELYKDFFKKDILEKIGINNSENEKSFREIQSEILSQKLYNEQLYQELINKQNILDKKSSIYELEQNAKDQNINLDVPISDNKTFFQKFGVPILLGVGVLLLIKKR